MISLSKRVLVSTVAVTALFAASSAMAQTRQFNIPSEEAAKAIPEFARQAGLQITAPVSDLHGVKTPAILGQQDVRAALAKLLGGTGLEVASDNGSTIVLRRSADAASPLPSRRSDVDSAPNPPGPAANVSLAEVVVTAQKQATRVKDVPVPVAVVNTTSLADNGQVLLRDYYSTIPGFQITPSYEQNQSLTIRGITTGNNALPTVGFVVDDVPFGSPIAQGNSLPDIDPGDLDHIEVLRGPQGTLYGASSMGGLVKFVTKAPSTAGLSGRVEFGTEGIQNGAEPGYQVRGSLNVPVSDQLAFRVSGFERQEPGYIDDPSLRQKGVNEAFSSGARFTGLWKPSDHFSVNVSALYQDDRANGVSDVTVAPGVGDLQQKFIPNVGTSDRITQAYSVTIKGDIGGVNLVSLTGYNTSHYKDIFDFSSASAFAGAVMKMYNVTGVPYADDFQPKNLTEEIRASGKIGDRIDWLVGGFLADDTNNLRQTAYAENTTTGLIVGNGDDGYYHYKYHEYAVFTDWTFHVTDRFNVQGGLRYSAIENVTGPYSIVEPIFTGNSIPVIQQVLDAHFNPVTFLVTPQYNVTKDIMVYARFSSGFRPGGGNLLFPGVPLTFTPDTTTNYEAGLKGDFLDHRLFVDASLYYVDWQDIQIQERTSTNHGFTGNGGRAKSEGVELSFEAHPREGLTVSAWGDYDQAVLTQAFPSTATVFGATGAQLPVTPTWSANASARQEFPIREDITGYVGGTVTYVGDRVGPFLAAGQVRQNYPAYTKLDLVLGARKDGWTVNVYANNITDERGILEGGAGAAIPTSFYYIRPRTVGVSVSKSF